MWVLILVLVEHTLRAESLVPDLEVGRSLNPCFSGTYSQSVMKDSPKTAVFAVLILVLVEHTLRERLLRTFSMYSELS